MKQFFLTASLLTIAASANAQNVDTILARMDQAAPAFLGMSADVRMSTYTAILSDTTTENGTLKMQRLKNGDMRAILDFSAATDARVIAFLGKIVRVYYPKLNAYQDYDVGKNSQALNQYLLLGFGSSGKALVASYKITAEGTEKIEGQDTTKLLLIPKDNSVLTRLTKVEIWVPTDASYPVQQQFYEPSGNWRRVIYTQITLNPPIAGTLDLKLPRGAKRQSQ